jgi:hypothetical protein
MNHGDDFPSQPKETNALLDYLLLIVGLVFIITAVGLFPLYLSHNNTVELASEETIDSGDFTLRVPSGSKTIPALAYSDQVPIVVMFDAEWCPLPVVLSPLY